MNLKTSCLAGLMPKTVWSRGRCKHYNDLQLAEQIRAMPEPTGAELAKLRRRSKARLAATEPHYDGLLDPAKRAAKSSFKRD